MNEKQWQTVSIPKPIIENIKKVLPWLGFPSVAEYIRYCLRERLRRDLLYVENLEENIQRAKDENP